MKLLLKHTSCGNIVQFEDTQNIDISKIDKQEIKCPNCKNLLISKDLK